MDLIGQIAILVFVIAMIVLAIPWWRARERKSLSREVRSKAPGQFIELSLGYVHYQLRGKTDAPLIVLLNGFSVPFYVWDSNVTGLMEGGFQVLRYDMFGRGYSDRPDITYDAALFDRQLEELLDALELSDKPLHLVGLSMGGAIAAHYACQHTQKVSSVSLLAPLHKPIPIGPLRIPGFGEWLSAVFVIPAFAENQKEDLVYPDNTPDWVPRYRRQMQYRGFRRALLSTLRHMMQRDPVADFKTLSNLGIPRLLLWGDKDRMFPIEESGRVLAALGEDAWFEVIEDAAHAMQFEKAEDVNFHLLTFLRQTLHDRQALQESDGGEAEIRRDAS